MKRNFLRHICFALIAILLVTFTATAAVMQQDDGGSRKVKIKVYLKMGKKGEPKPAKTVQYCTSFRSINKALDAANRINVANTKVFSGDPKALEKELRSLGIAFKLSKSNGEIEEFLMSGQGVVVFDEEYGAKAVEIKSGQDKFTVTLESSDQILDETVVDGKYRNTNPTMKPVPGMDTGDRVTFNVNFTIPEGYTTEKSRIICQPMAVDCQTEDTIAYLQPIILEGAEYHKKQDKRMGFNYMKNDSVARGYDPSYVLERDKEVAYSTNVTFKKPDKEKTYRGSYRVVLEDYHHRTWDSGEMTTGSCLAFKPLKFLDFSVTAAEMPLTSEFQEAAEENMANVTRDLRLKFAVGKDVLLNDSMNIVEQQAIVKELKSYGDLLWDVQVQGGASPEGSVELNTRLATQRAAVARNILKRHLSSDIRVSTLEPRVFTWEDVLEQVGKNGNQEVYDVVKNTIETYKPNEVFGMLKLQPFFESDIAPILENLRIMVVKYRYEIKHIMNAEEAVENYFAHKREYISGEKKMSNGDYFNLLATVTDSLELDTITTLAYKHVIAQSDYTRLKLAPYVANQMALMASRRGMPDVNILKPFIDFRKGVNQMDMSDRYNPVKINREQLVLNQAVMYFQEAKLDTAMFFIEMLEKKNVQLQATKRLRMLITFQQGYPFYIQGLITDPEQVAKIKEAERYVFSTGDDNRAIIYTELHGYLNKSRKECEALIDRMPDDNPKKWYLKGIIWADEWGREPQIDDYSAANSGFKELTEEEENELLRTDPEKAEEYYKQLDEYKKKNTGPQLDVSKVPFYLAYFQHSFDLEPKFIRLYRNEGNVNDDIRKKSKYMRKDIPAYRKKFEILKAYTDRKKAEESGAVSETKEEVQSADNKDNTAADNK